MAWSVTSEIGGGDTRDVHYVSLQFGSKREGIRGICDPLAGKGEWGYTGPLIDFFSSRDLAAFRVGIENDDDQTLWLLTAVPDGMAWCWHLERVERAVDRGWGGWDFMYEDAGWNVLEACTRLPDPNLLPTALALAKDSFIANYTRFFFGGGWSYDGGVQCVNTYLDAWHRGLVTWEEARSVLAEFVDDVLTGDGADTESEDEDEDEDVKKDVKEDLELTAIERNAAVWLFRTPATRQMFMWKVRPTIDKESTFSDGYEPRPECLLSRCKAMQAIVYGVDSVDAAGNAFARMSTCLREAACALYRLSRWKARRGLLWARRAKRSRAAQCISEVHVHSVPQPGGRHALGHI